MGTVVYIHENLRATYDRAYRRARDEALKVYGDSTLDQLHQARRDLDNYKPGTLSIRLRAQTRGEADVLDELIERAVLAHAQ